MRGTAARAVRPGAWACAGLLLAVAPVAAQRADYSPPPPLPWRYVGSWSMAGRTTVMLARGRTTRSVDGPGPLDAQYRVVAIEPGRLLVEYLPRTALQVLPMQAPPAATDRAARPPLAAPQAHANNGALAVVVSGSEHPDN